MFTWQRLVAVIVGMGLVALALRWVETRIEATRSPAIVPTQTGSQIERSAEPIAIADRETRRVHWIRSNGHNQGTQAIPEERRIYLFTQADVDRVIDEDGFRFAK